MTVINIILATMLTLGLLLSAYNYLKAERESHWELFYSIHTFGFLILLFLVTQGV